MPKKQAPKRKNKSRAELLQEADRKKQIEKLMEDTKNQKQLFREKILPVLHEMDDEIRYMTIFLHTLSVAAQGAAEEAKKEILIKDLDLLKHFDPKAPETENYKKIFEIMGDETVGTFDRMFSTAPQMISEYLYKQSEKKRFNDIDYDQILSKD